MQERGTLATWLLENAAKFEIDAVSNLAGLRSPESLRRHCRLCGLPSPARYRGLDKAA